jgi:hypothetical protein
MSKLNLNEFFLGYWWFYKPPGYTTSEWEEERAQTMIHEAAHLVGIERTFREKSGPGDAKSLARRNPVGARRNADNYGYYVMSFLRD